jgi:hypothetical protein
MVFLDFMCYPDVRLNDSIQYLQFVLIQTQKFSEVVHTLQIQSYYYSNYIEIIFSNCVFFNK